MEPLVTEEQIGRQPPEAQAIIRVLLAKIAKLEAEIECLRRQVQGTTPQNSSLPPSTQHPHAKPAPRKHKSKRKRGGQRGHKRHERPLVPTKECDDVKPLALSTVACAFQALLSLCPFNQDPSPSSQNHLASSASADLAPTLSPTN